MILLAVVVAGAGTPARAADDLATVLARGAEPAWGLRVAHAWGAVRRFYAARNHQPIWLDGGRPTAHARAAVAALADAASEGLDPARYDAAGLAAKLDAKTPLGPAFEAALTGELLHYVADLRHGRLALPGEMQDDTYVRPVKFDAADPLRRLLAANDMAATLHAMAPANAPYRALRDALARYRKIRAAGGWPILPPGPTLAPGMQDARVPELRRRLTATGDLPAAGQGDPSSSRYDKAVAAAVVRFQRRHGLTPDGIVGRNTLAALDVPVASRIAQLGLNMERWRWMPNDLGKRYLLVNLAGFDLEVVDDGVDVLRMRVVVGQPYRRTPVFTGELSYLEFSPTWTVPPTILKEDLIPAARADPDYLVRHGIAVYDGWNGDAHRLDPHAIDWQGGDARLLAYRYVQPPGPHNPLGGVKFMLPNPFSIYLHDTPERGLFNHVRRTFSSGCIRVERAADLAAYLLRDQPQWTRDAIEAAMHAASPKRVNLKQSLPVHVVYATAWATDGGAVEFRPDVYGRDASLRESIAAAGPVR